MSHRVVRVSVLPGDRRVCSRCGQPVVVTNHPAVPGRHAYWTAKHQPSTHPASTPTPEEVTVTDSTTTRFETSMGLPEGPGGTPTTIVRDSLLHDIVMVFGGPDHEAQAQAAVDALNRADEVTGGNVTVDDVVMALLPAARASMGQDL